MSQRPAASGHEILFPPLPHRLTGRMQQALDDAALRRTVQGATLIKDHGRRQIFAASFGERYDALRDLAGRIRQHTLDHLDHYLDQFIDRAAAAGAKVHFAGDDAQARDIVLDIARRRGARLCVKSKSMVTEEIDLAPALEGIGCRTIETDLGEFIVQIDHDAPSHIVTPMIHKDRAAVGRAFVRELGVEYTEDPQKLTAIARTHLRERFRTADLGMSGGNFLVASSGSVVICTNEGNGRMCTSAPPVHVAVVGIEKIVPTHEHLAVMLKLLARSSTAQPITVYTHIVTGPRRAGEQDGPGELHIVLVDHGRSRLLAGPDRELLRCIRCGACLNACPVYRMVGGHAYGAVYSGPIGAVLTPALRGLDNYPDLAGASALCGACFEACPVKIDIPRHLTRLRNQVARGGMAGLAERAVFAMWTWTFMQPWRYALANWMLRLALRRLARRQGGGDFVRRLPGPAGAWTQARDLPAPATESFAQWWRSRAQREGPH